MGYPYSGSRRDYFFRKIVDDIKFGFKFKHGSRISLEAEVSEEDFQSIKWILDFPEITKKRWLKWRHLSRNDLLNEIYSEILAEKLLS